MNSPNIITRRIVLHRNGDPIHFDVTVDLDAIVARVGYKAERSARHVTKIAEGAVKVVHIP
jgi:hypothetical protein